MPGDMLALDRNRIEQRPQIVRKNLDRVGPRRLVGLAVPALVVAHDAIAVAEPRRDAIPDLEACGDPMDQHQRIPRAFNETAERDAVDPDRFHVRHLNSCLAPAEDASRAAVRYRGIVTTYTCASGGLGHGLPAAIGVALARPHEKIIALLGDGSSMYAIQGLWSAVQLALGITFVIIKNQRYEALLEFGRHFGLQRTIGTSLPNIDFCALARGQGVKAISVNRRDALDDALRSAFASTAEPTLVEVAVD
jgi:thiamine pyrophosphate-dependent acetolactate synthase large subunit-like protein